MYPHTAIPPEDSACPAEKGLKRFTIYSTVVSIKLSDVLNDLEEEHVFHVFDSFYAGGCPWMKTSLLPRETVTVIFNRAA